MCTHFISSFLHNPRSQDSMGDPARFPVPVRGENSICALGFPETSLLNQGLAPLSLLSCLATPCLLWGPSGHKCPTGGLEKKAGQVLHSWLQRTRLVSQDGRMAIHTGTGFCCHVNYVGTVPANSSGKDGPARGSHLHRRPVSLPW